MKSLLSGLLCASLLAFAISCGKDSKSGGSSTPQYSNLFNSGLSVTSQQVLEKVTSWYNGTTEGQGLVGIVNITKTKYTYNTTPNCTQKTFIGIPYQYCSYSNSSTQGTIISQQNNVNLYNTGAIINAKGNQDLNSIFSGASGTLLTAIDLSSSRSQLDFLRSDGVIVSYIIDRNYHSLLNPINKTESSQSSKSEIVVTAQRIY